MSKNNQVLPLSKITPDPKNPRQEFDPETMRMLEDSVRENGIMTALQVEEIGDGTYLLVDGERRFRTAKKLGIKEVPVVILEKMDDKQRMVRRFHLQEQHAQWNTWEKALAVSELQYQSKMTKNELSKSLGISGEAINRYLMVSILSKRMATRVMERKLPFDWMVEIGRTVSRVEDASKRRALESSLVDKIDNKVIIKARELRRYRKSVFKGGDKIVDKIIKGKTYTALQASEDSGYFIREKLNYLHTHALTAIGCGAYVLKNPKEAGKLNGSLHNAIVKCKEMCERLEKMPYQKD